MESGLAQEARYKVSARYLERQIKICKQADALSLSLEEVVERQKRAYRADFFGKGVRSESEVAVRIVM